MTIGANAISLGDMSLQPVSGGSGIRPGTIVRLVGSLTVQINQSGSGQWGAGISLMTEDALALGATAAPNPLGGTNDNFQGWYWWFADTAGAVDPGELRSYDFDIRSKRRVRSGFGLGLVFETATFSGLTNITMNLQARALWMPE